MDKLKSNEDKIKFLQILNDNFNLIYFPKHLGIIIFYFYLKMFFR